MEEITTISLVVGLATTIATILGKVIDKWISGFWKHLDNDKYGIYDGNQDMQIGILTTKEQRNENDIAEIKRNHLMHQEKIERQMETNAQEHQKIFIILERIDGKLK